MNMNFIVITNLESIPDLNFEYLMMFFHLDPFLVHPVHPYLALLKVKVKKVKVKI